MEHTTVQQQRRQGHTALSKIGTSVGRPFEERNKESSRKNFENTFAIDRWGDRRGGEMEEKKILHASTILARIVVLVRYGSKQQTYHNHTPLLLLVLGTPHLCTNTAANQPTPSPWQQQQQQQKNPIIIIEK